ncbi:MAG: hypothetical protein AAFR16_04715 [Pseudomonadota bacterium]
MAERAAAGTTAETARVVDHAASERRLHRALYYIRYLRAVLLNVIMVALAGAATLALGFGGFYPGVEEAITQVEKEAAALQALQGVPVEATYAVALITTALVPVLLAFTYLAVTRVWRWTLRAQAVLVALYALVYVAGPLSQRQLAFALEKLDPLFAGLAAFAHLLFLYVALDMAWRLWSVSRVREIASFRATLDPALAPTAWAYANKFFDFPRTPFRTWRNAAAYALHVAAAFGVVFSVFYLLMVGQIAAKLGAYEATCFRDVLADCVRDSAADARAILIGLPIAFLGLKAAALAQAFARRLGALGVDAALRRRDARFLLYLRPFTIDALILPKPKLPFLSSLFEFRPFPRRIEDELFDVADGWRPLIAVGQPWGGDAAEGAHRAYLAHDAWRDFVRDHMRRAEAIVMIVNDETEGVLWEFDAVIAEGAAEKTLYFFDPAGRDPEVWRRLAETARAKLVGAGVLPRDAAFAGQALAFYIEDGRLMEIHNAEWTATSHRTAFSEYLSRRARRGAAGRSDPAQPAEPKESA